jgi:hypothetical protein
MNPLTMWAKLLYWLGKSRRLDCVNQIGHDEAVRSVATCRLLPKPALSHQVGKILPRDIEGHLATGHNPYNAVFISV